VASGMVSRMDATQPLEHGGDLDAARRLFPDAPQPFIDLSTGINPHSYPLPRFSEDSFTRLPQPAMVARLAEIAAAAYGAPSAAHVVAAPGTQILLSQVAALVPPGRAAILGPTYGELARAAALVGHAVMETEDMARLRGADLVFVVNPNNPDGRIVSRGELLALAEALRASGGLLVVDEAFMDVEPVEASLAGDVALGNIVVLRSFGKFYGLAGLRLGFALTAPAIAARLTALLGPWAISGAAIDIGVNALVDVAWQNATRNALINSAQRLDTLLIEAGLNIVGGTALFRLAQTPAAEIYFQKLGRAGILVRRFAQRPTWLRFGLPGAEAEWRRLQSVISSVFSASI
jgi:cobalamin biosynthesis protein CobC